MQPAALHRGLFVKKEEKTAKNPLQVRRARDAEDGLSFQELHGRSVLDSKFMKKRRKKYESNIAELLPGELGGAVQVESN